MVGIITTPEAEIEQKREVKLTDGAGRPTEGSTASGFSEIVGAFVVPSDQRYGTGVTVPVQPVVEVRGPWGAGRIVWSRDATANDSDKTILTVPANKVARVLMVYAGIKCSADVGTRILVCKMTNGTAGQYVYESSYAAPTASQNACLFLSTTAGYFASNTLRKGPDDASANAGYVDILPEMYLPAGYTVQVLDSAAIAAGADDLTTVIHYIEYDA